MNANVKLPAAQGVFIDNKWQPAQSGRSIAMLAPATGQVIASIAAGDAPDVDLAVAAARRALEESRLSLKEIACRSGFADEEKMRRAFHRVLGVSPRDYRTKFGSWTAAYGDIPPRLEIVVGKKAV